MKNNHKVLVTGAAGALGSAVIERFQRSEYEVVGTYRGKKPTSNSAIQWLEVDVTDPASIKRGLAAHEFDTLVHCAGGFRFSPVEKVTDSDLSFLLDLNLRSSFYLARELLPGMKARGFGRMLFVSSKATLQPTAGMAAYAASKAGLNALVLSLADELKGTDVTVNAVLPSVIDTPANRKDMPKADFSKWVSAKELADILYFLTQPWGRAIHGALIPVTGRV